MYKRGKRGYGKGFSKRSGSMKPVNGVEPKSTIDNGTRSRITKEVKDPSLMGEKIKSGYEKTIR